MLLPKFGFYYPKIFIVSIMSKLLIKQIENISNIFNLKVLIYHLVASIEIIVFNYIDKFKQWFQIID